MQAGDPDPCTLLTNPTRCWTIQVRAGPWFAGKLSRILAEAFSEEKMHAGDGHFSGQKRVGNGKLAQNEVIKQPYKHGDQHLTRLTNVPI